MTRCSLLRTVTLVCALAFASAARADGDSTSHYEVGANIWGSSLAVHVNDSSGDVSMHIPFSDLASHLNGGLELVGRADWDRWSLVFDGLYAHLSGDEVSKTARFGPQGGIAVSADVKSRLDEWIVELNGGYRLLQTGSLFSNRPSDSRKFWVETYAGARYWSVDPKIEVTTIRPSGVTKFRVGDREQWIDPYVGLRFAADLSSSVVFRINGDVGGFNIGNYCSDFTWSQVTALTWRFGESWSTHIGYKFLDFHRASGDTSERIQLRGPFIALTYGF